MANEIYGKLNAREETEEWTGLPTNTTDTVVDNDQKTIRVYAKVNTEQLELDMDALKVDVAGVKAEIAGMDASISQTAGGGNGYLTLQLTENNGKVTNLSGYIESGHYEAAGAAETVKTELIEGASTEYNTLGKIQTKLINEAYARDTKDTALNTKIEAETTRATGAEQTLTNTANGIRADLTTETGAREYEENLLKGRVKTLEDKVGDQSEPSSASGSLYARIKKEVEDRGTAVSNEAGQRQAADTDLSGRITTNTTEISSLKTRVSATEEQIPSLDNKITAEKNRAEGVESQQLTKINALEEGLTAETSARTTKDLAQDADISSLNNKVGSSGDDPLATGSLFARIKQEVIDRTTSDSNLNTAIETVQTNLNTHAAKKDNPHEVTKAQVGLSDVVNKSMDSTPTADSENYVTSGGVKSYVDNYSGKINTITVNGQVSALPIVDKNVTIPRVTKNNQAVSFIDNTFDIDVPTKTSDLTNDSGFLTEHQSLSAYSTTSEMNTAIAAHHDNSKLNTLATGAGAQGDLPYNLPYYFYTVPDASKIEVHTKTITLDNNSTQGDYSLDVTSATTTTAGLMSAADKTKLDGITVPTKTSELVNDSGFLTEHQSLAAYSTTEQMNAAIQTAITNALTNFFSAGVKATTTLPTEDKPEAEQNNLTFVVTATEPATKYKGYAYIVTGA